jgi:hypothetical protein
MRKIPPEDFDEMFGHGSGGSTSPLYNYLMNMKVGEACELLKKDWHPKYAPTTVVNRVERRHNMKFDRKGIPDRSGWRFKRVK